MYRVLQKHNTTHKGAVFSAFHSQSPNTEIPTAILPAVLRKSENSSLTLNKERPYTDSVTEQFLGKICGRKEQAVSA